MYFLKKNIRNRAGQATVEYLLLIVLVIAIATGIGRPLGHYLTEFSGALLGEEGYYACLTEKGLLPGDSRASSCNRSADLALNNLNQISSGNAFSSTGSSGSGPSSNLSSGFNNSSSSDSDSSSDSSSSGSKNKNKNAKRHKASSSSGKGDSLASSAGSGSGSVSGDSSESPASFSAFPSGLSSKNKKKKKRKKRSGYRGGAESDSEDTSFNSEETGYKRKQTRFKRGQGHLGEAYSQETEKEEQEKPVFKASQSSEKTGAFAGESKKNKLISDRKPSENSEADAKVKGMDFSSFLKYFVIIALIVVVFIVIFSQVMEYQSRD